MINPLEKVVVRLSKKIPGLGAKLVQAGIKKTPEQFIFNVIVSSFYTTAVIVFSIALLFSKLTFVKGLVVALIPILFLMMFFYFLQLPDVRKKIIERALEKEVVYASRFLIIELQSGVSLYHAFVNIVDHYPAIGKVFQRIVQAVDLGSPMEVAIDDAIETCPSSNVRRILLQIKNALESGADVTSSLIETARQITTEQMILVKEYGRKLNPFVMFFMMIAVIMPSLGATAFIVLASFMSISVDLTVLLVVVVMIAFIQFVFLNMIKSSRPPVEYD